MTQNLKPFRVNVQRSASDHGQILIVMAQDESGARVIARKAYATRHNLSAAFQTFAQVVPW